MHGAVLEQHNLRHVPPNMGFDAWKASQPCRETAYCARLKEAGTNCASAPVSDPNRVSLVHKHILVLSFSTIIILARFS
jgi:hypothetical protein